MSKVVFFVRSIGKVDSVYDHVASFAGLGWQFPVPVHGSSSVSCQFQHRNVHNPVVHTVTKSDNSRFLRTKWIDNHLNSVFPFTNNQLSQWVDIHLVYQCVFIAKRVITLTTGGFQWDVCHLTSQNLVDPAKASIGLLSNFIDGNRFICSLLKPILNLLKFPTFFRNVDRDSNLVSLIFDSTPYSLPYPGVA